MGDAWPTQGRSHEARAWVARMRTQPAPLGRWHRRLRETSVLCRPKVALEGDTDHGELSIAWAINQPRSPPYGRDRDVLIVGYLSNDTTQRVHPSGPDARSRASFWWQCRRIARGVLGIVRRRRKFPCQAPIKASRSVTEQTNARFGATVARRHPDQCAPVVDPSFGACAILQPRRGRGVASRSRPTDRRDRRISADARVPIRARDDANQYRPQP
jgi:hypothetical protein